MFLIMSATMMVITFTVVFSEIYQDNIRDKKYLLGTDLAYSIQNEFIVASQVHDGYKRTFTVPYNLEGFDYDIGIVRNTLVINNTITLPIPPVKGNLVKGPNTLEKNNNTLCLNC